MASNFKGFRVIHNGYEIKYFDKYDQVEEYMESVVSAHKNLNPKKIMDRQSRGSKELGCCYIRIVRFRYSTLYEEDFIIDINL